MAKIETAATWRSFIGELESKLEALAIKAAELREQKRGPALGAARGDAKAAAELAKINGELSAAERAAEDSSIALEEAREALAEAEEREHRSAELERLRSVRDLAQQRDKLGSSVGKTVDALVTELGKVRANADDIEALLAGTPQEREVRAVAAWPRDVAEMLMARCAAAGIRLDHAGASVNTEATLAIGPATWSDERIEELAERKPLRVVDGDDAPAAA